MKASWFMVVIALGCAERQSPPATVDPQPPPPAPAPAPPPAPSPAPTTQCSGPPPGAGYECVQDCGPPVSTGNEPPPGWSWLSAEDAAKRKQFGCPICLPHDALIATPHGDVPISQLKTGELVWSVSADGQRVARRIERIVSVRAPAQHHLAVIDLEDGRRLRASPGHPDADGHAIGDTHVGHAFDGSRVRAMTRVPYRGHTFDLVLEAGATHYFANGILLRSSIR